jgi:hypothetical protein
LIFRFRSVNGNAPSKLSTIRSKALMRSDSNFPGRIALQPVIVPGRLHELSMSVFDRFLSLCDLFKPETVMKHSRIAKNDLKLSCRSFMFYMINELNRLQNRVQSTFTLQKRKINRIKFRKFIFI